MISLQTKSIIDTRYKRASGLTYTSFSSTSKPTPRPLIVKSLSNNNVSLFKKEKHLSYNLFQSRHIGIGKGF